ncbi:hypothetical protein PORY_002461 [Pneumocystis oryctolagi]|uniref:Uncharacterized protein n=1 Tax=Pneumocystis oryctolagi TaxID=42067 RepID=A0ACB7C8T0_9ASCO|nr:hypothetical protein PORY_002461 [Pneumocystis oryctolagi]
MSSLYNHRPVVPSTASGRLAELLEAVRNEFDNIAQEAMAFRNHKDDYEHKITSQIQEMQTIRQTIYELEMAHQKMKQSYDEEIARLRRELESRGIHLPVTSQPSLPLLSNPPNLPFPPPNIGLNTLPVGRAPNHNDPKTCLAPLDTNQPTLPLPYPNTGYPPVNNVHTLQSCPQHSNKRVCADANIDNNTYNVSKSSNYSTVSGSSSPSGKRNKPLTNRNEAVSNSFISVHQPPARPVPPPSSLTPTVPPPVSSLSLGQTSMSIADMDPDMIPREFKKEGSDWTVLFNPNIPRVLDINFVHTLEHQSVVCCIRFSNDGEYLATGCNRVALIFDVKTGKRLTILQDESVDWEGDLYVRSIAFSPDGKYLATGAEDKRIRIWDIAKKKIRHLFTGHEQDIYSLDYSQNGKFIASGSGDRTTRVWDIETGHCILTLSIEDGVTTVAISPDSRYVAAGSLDKVVRVWDAKTGHLVERFEDHKDSVYSVAFTPNGCGLLSGSLDKTIKLWELSDTETSAPKSGLCKATLTGHKDFVLSVASSPDGHWVLSGSKDRGVQFWDYHGRAQLILQGHKNSVISVAVSPTGRLFATGSGDCRARTAGIGFVQGFLAGQIAVWILVCVFLKFFVFSDGKKTSTSLRSSLRKQLQNKQPSIYQPVLPSTVVHFLSKVYGNLSTHPAESLDWLNVLIAQAIIQFRSDMRFKEGLLNYMDDILNGQSKPNFLGHIKVVDVNMGEDFPVCRNCRVISRADISNHFDVVMDVDFVDEITLSIETQFVLNYPKYEFAVLPIVLSLSIIRFSGTLSISLVSCKNQLDTSNIAAFIFSFSPDFQLDINVHSLVGARSKLQDIPKISQFLEFRIRNWFIEKCVDPHFQCINIPNIWLGKTNNYSKPCEQAFAETMKDMKNS